jgi:hypothetical protein
MSTLIGHVLAAFYVIASKGVIGCAPIRSV